MAKISGILTDGAGQIINNCTIELYAKKTTGTVLTQTQAFHVANNGSYMMNVLPCDYEVKLIINGFPPKRIGTIQVFSDSADGSLNDFLLNPSESEITPAILQQVIDARNDANKAASNAEKSVKNIKELGNSIESVAQSAKTSADNAKASETNAKNIAHSVEGLVANASNSAQSASESATTATNASTSAKSYSDSAKSYADSASSSATASHNSAQQSSNSANAASSSESNAKTSEQNAAKSADDAKNAALSIDTTVFIKKSGVDNQSINGSLDVKKLTEQGQRVYSPNNKPTADDIGALSVTLNNEDGKKEIDSFLRFKKRPEFNNSDILTRDDYVGLLNENGYQKLPSGLIIQWGIANSSYTRGEVIPAIAFPNRVLSVHFTDTNSEQATNSTPISWRYESTTVNRLTWSANEPPGLFSFFAIGY
ncbi:Prophage tail fibre N-terminal domain-containing protein [Gilliamella bombicola]|uniref:Prophage tail fibre N-terminal domain-containing protein n=1 Tax=Gilliamella bombicola TaxID=1798182 RepID=A0A1C4A0T8_9GAMM|nr:prophage tail fiber N-terminal domain-containing protein [Gilliamella bombicola]SCB88152.1 Prophage tail fibre N-terminal domain-containing protein [Gilliamella bombicola]